MTSAREDDALSWDGDDDPTLDVGVAPRADVPRTVEGSTSAGNTAVPPLPDGWTAVGKGAAEAQVDAAATDAAKHPASAALSESTAVSETSAAADPAPLGNAALVSLGVFGGIFLLYAIGWYLGATRLAAYQEVTGYGLAIGLRTLADDFMFLGWVMLATLAAPIWFITSVYLTQGARFWKRFVALLGGAVLLVPWPFLMLGAVGA